eukprot:PhM_4_TR6337/c0_g1_i1/m.52492/K01875/SARS, serS; seryl-tRNA synthetase
MVLDINLFRTERGGNPDLIRESQRRRYADPTAVDRVIDLDKKWRQSQNTLENLRKCANTCSKATGIKMKAAGGAAPTEEVTLADIPKDVLAAAESGTLKQETVDPLSVGQLNFLSKYIKATWIPEETKNATDYETRRDKVLDTIGNIVHESIPVDCDEDKNRVVRTIGDVTKRCKYNHVDLMEMLGMMDCGDRVTKMSGGRAFVLKGDLVLLQLALVQYSMSFLVQRGYQPFYPPFFLNKESMSAVAQLAQFDEELYKVTGEGDDKYLIATSEQPVCAYHRNQWISEQELETPMRYAGYSTCFRKEAGSHGRDTLGIFRVHQFDKIEQFIVCSPRDNTSWKMHDEMIATAEEFYNSLGLPYQVIDIVTGALNNAAARKFDLEAWFPASGKFRELVSASNCTDYQSRSINCRYGGSNRGTSTHNVKEHPHMLNATLCAITRTMCCIVENNQTDEGIVIPDVLRPFMASCNGLMKFKHLVPPSQQQQQEAPKKKK